MQSLIILILSATSVLSHPARAPVAGNPECGIRLNRGRESSLDPDHLLRLRSVTVNVNAANAAAVTATREKTIIREQELGLEASAKMSP